MPYCETCAKFWNPASMPVDGTCPTCGRTIADSQAPGEHDPDDPGGDVPPPPRAPWHFWVMVAAAALYLGWRLLQGLVWLIDSAL